MLPQNGAHHQAVAETYLAVFAVFLEPEYFSDVLLHVKFTFSGLLEYN